MSGILPPDAPALPDWKPWVPAGNDALSSELRHLEDCLLTDLGGPGWRVDGGTGETC